MRLSQWRMTDFAEHAICPMSVAGIVHAEEEVLIDCPSQDGRLLSENFSGALRCDVEIETVDKQIVVKRVDIGRHRFPVHVEPHGRDVGNTIS